MSYFIRPAEVTDAAAIAAIYNHYVEHTAISFEEQPVPVDEMAGRITTVLQQGLPYLVAVLDDDVVGYCYATPWKARAAYRYSVEVTVYLAATAQGRGLGYALYQQLFATLKAAGYHAALGGIVQPNPGSVALHEKCGMTQVALLPDIGFKFGQWHSVGYWQLLL
ncbi:arsinothricin resistance N-acetyltransferase ArsN1 family B [Rheinheimera sp. F8]|uniref:arsinothricin resistance N-acetyltransferase ArsN1 family B n=1 Tax=Rheinheimera sp. F8 TaxID=1763998 RepID=UPI000744BE8B|nr:arsinothricin resistance N-acetyltransferase ArsN1 family B [Rheinheimera sp. F8]ALZ77263.1 phosphinothricin acetyltransferase [Rheinheimera sp. F8]